MMRTETSRIPVSAILNVKNQRRGRADLLKRLIKGDFRGCRISPSCVPNQSQVDGNECEGEDNQKYGFRHDRSNSSSREKSEQDPGIGFLYLYHTRSSEQVWWSKNETVTEFDHVCLKHNNRSLHHALDMDTMIA